MIGETYEGKMDDGSWIYAEAYSSDPTRFTLYIEDGNNLFKVFTNFFMKNEFILTEITYRATHQNPSILTL